MRNALLIIVVVLFDSGCGGPLVRYNMVAAVDKSAEIRRLICYQISQQWRRVACSTAAWRRAGAACSTAAWRRAGWQFTLPDLLSI